MKPFAPRNIRRRHAGFTLIEVLLALVLIVGMVGGLMAFYQQAVEIRSFAQEAAQDAHVHRVFMERLTSDLRGATSSALLGYSISGSGDRIQILTTALPRPGVWDAKDSDKAQPTPTQDLRVVGYGLQTYVDEENITHIVGLEQTWKTSLLPQYTEESQFDPALLVTPEYRFLHLRYYDGGNWVESWSGGALPVAVEVTIGRQPLPDGTEPIDYPFETHQRTIYLPASGVAPVAVRQARAANPAPPNPEGETPAATQPAEGGTP